MRIAFDVAGFENDLDEAIRAARRFVRQYDDVELLLVGDQEAISKHRLKSKRIAVVNATQAIAMTDDIAAIRAKPDASMLVAIHLVNSGRADGIVSAGSTAPFVAACVLLIGTLPGVRRAGFMPWLPSAAPFGTNMLDVGANKESTAEDLRQFAVMGSIYFQKVNGVERPVVKVLNIGTEANKGLPLQAEADKLLRDEKAVNYGGFVESRDLLNNAADIVVCDGYSGNLVLKAMEGSLNRLIRELKGGYKLPYGWLGGLFSLPVFARLASKFDYKNNAGALVIGLKRIAVKTHGQADAAQFFSSLRLCRDCIKQEVVSHIANGLAGENKREA